MILRRTVQVANYMFIDILHLLDELVRGRIMKQHRSDSHLR